MTGSTRGRDWVRHAQKLLLSLRDIAGASISLDEDESRVAEINILAEGNRPPKQIVRDVRSALKAEYQLDVDYRKVVVAQKQDPEADRDADQELTVLSLPANRVYEEPAASRLRFGGVTVSLDEARCRARVELSLGGRETVGEASGAASRRQVHRLVAQATLEAVSRFLDDRNTLVLADFEVLRLGGEDIVVVAVKFSKERTDKVLTGSCAQVSDLQQSVVYATLDALNRILGRLQLKEPVEYEIRPTSLP